MTLFKKTFLIILCGLLCVEGFHIYIDYKEEQYLAIRESVKMNEVPDILSDLERENEYKSVTLEDAKKLFYEAIQNCPGYFSIIDPKGQILYERESRYQFGRKMEIISTDWNYFDLSELPQHSITKIENYIVENRNSLLKIQYQGKENQNDYIIPTYIAVNNTVIFGEVDDEENIKDEIIHLYEGLNIYYRDYTGGENTKPKLVIKEEYLDKIRNISNELYDEFGAIGATRIGYKIVGQELQISEKSLININGELCYFNYSSIYENALDNLMFQTVYPKYTVYNIAAVVIVIMSLLISYMVTYRIKKMHTASVLIGNRFFDVKIKDNSKDEIGDLARIINKMSDKLGKTDKQLNQEVEKVKELESLRKDFINQFTHEMKIPLGIINGYSELIEEAETDEEKQKYLDIINRETVRINDLVQAMLKLSRLESGKVELSKEQLDLEDIISEVVDEFEVLLMKKNIKVEVNVIDKNIYGDKQQLMTVIRNFISNAIKHTDTKIIVTINKGVKVYNEGKPIDEDKLNGIWYTFVTHDKTGTGLGLAICRSILELHNYQYGVTNREDGVEFYFHIK